MKRAALPAGFVGWGQPLADGGDDVLEEDEYAAFRLRLKDILQNCIVILQGDMLQQLNSFVTAESDWMTAEAVLFAYCCVGHPVRRMVNAEQIAAETADAQLSSIFAWILGPGVGVLAGCAVAQCTASKLVRATLIPSCNNGS